MTDLTPFVLKLLAARAHSFSTALFLTYTLHVLPRAHLQMAYEVGGIVSLLRTAYIESSSSLKKAQSGNFFLPPTDSAILLYNISNDNFVNVQSCISA